MYDCIGIVCDFVLVGTRIMEMISYDSGFFNACDDDVESSCANFQLLIFFSILVEWS